MEDQGFDGSTGGSGAFALTFESCGAGGGGGLAGGGGGGGAGSAACGGGGGGGGFGGQGGGGGQDILFRDLELLGQGELEDSAAAAAARASVGGAAVELEALAAAAAAVILTSICPPLASRGSRRRRRRRRGRRCLGGGIYIRSECHSNIAVTKHHITGSVITPGSLAVIILTPPSHCRPSIRKRYFIRSTGLINFDFPFSTNTLSISNPIASEVTTGTGGGGTGGLQMTGLGTLTLPAGSTYTGSTVISGGGTIQITADSALGPL